MNWNSELDRIVDEQPDFLIEDENGLYFPTDAEIDHWQASGLDDEAVYIQ